MTSRVCRWFLGLIIVGLSTSGHAQKTSDKKDPTPVVLFPMPLGVDAGRPSKVVLRGLRLDQVTEIRVHEPKSSARLLGKGKKAEGVTQQLPATLIGDTQIEVEFHLCTEVPGESVSFAVIGPGGESPPAKILIHDAIPRTPEKEPNPSFRQAQLLQLPTTVEGTIQNPQDVDVFAFDAQADQEIFVEVLAQRFGSPADLHLALYDSEGRILASVDDVAGQTDPKLRMRLPKKGRYFISLLETHDQGSPMFVYQLRVKRGK